MPCMPHRHQCNQYGNKSAPTRVLSTPSLSIHTHTLNLSLSSLLSPLSLFPSLLSSPLSVSLTSPSLFVHIVLHNLSWSNALDESCAGAFDELPIPQPHGITFRFNFFFNYLSFLHTSLTPHTTHTPTPTHIHTQRSRQTQEYIYIFSKTNVMRMLDIPLHVH